jgi:lipopolysaccharide transport system ATP-binding protein
MTEPVIRLQNVSKRYSLRRHEGASLAKALLRTVVRAPRSGYHYALTDVTLEVHRGSSLAVLGVNGGGKTTLLKLISGVTLPTTGTVEVRGRVGGVVELGAGFHLDLSGIENVFMHATLLGLSRAEIRRRLETILDFAELGSFVHAPVRQYSWGMMLRLAFAIAVHTDPDILLIDEALAVGDGYFQWKCLRKMAELRERGTTLLFVTHVPELAEAMCDQAVWLDAGRVRALGPTHRTATQYNDHVLKDAVQKRPVGSWRTDVFGLMPYVRVGSGQVLIESVRLLGPAGGSTRVFNMHDPVTIEIVVEAQDRVPGVAVCIGIERVGQGVAIINSRVDGGVFDVPPGKSTLKAVIPDLSLYTGSYYISISLFEAGDISRIYDSHVKIQTFRVNEPENTGRYSTRSVYLPARVEWEADETATN